MAISPEKRKKLRKVLYQIDPPTGVVEVIESTEKLLDIMKGFEERISAFESSFESFEKSVNGMIQKKTGEYEMKVGSLDGILSSHMEKHQKMIADGFKKSKDDLEKTKEEFSQIVKKVEDGVRISYSKMGGGTMPQLLQQENAQFVPDGVTTTYYFYNKPVYIVVGGAILVNGDGYVFSTTQPVDGYNITFDNPPAAASGEGSAQTPHSFHY